MCQNTQPRQRQQQQLSPTPNIVARPTLSATHLTSIITATGIFCYLWLFLFHAVAPIHARRLQRCELAGQLYILDVPKSELSLWLCIAHYESRYNTHVVGNRNADGSSDYGLFQISGRYWCQPDNGVKYHVFNECNVTCNALLQDDITEAVECARTIQRRQGWSAWSVYSVYCNRTLTAVDDCFDGDFDGLQEVAGREEK
ncbi:lysozyme 1 [Ceratitis capitata]|uniref:lysozyme 1 n=1 Tax=Ceratitis capitata TaxID=7213 RepID=UPI00061893E1|nr:lysozyme 1 [Ceratitis capitata]